MLPEVRDRIDIATANRSEPHNDRWRSFEAVAATLCIIAAREPLLLVLEDLHDADHGTLDMLQHLARSIAESRLLVLVTYRDVQVVRTHLLTSVLA